MNLFNLLLPAVTWEMRSFAALAENICRTTECFFALRSAVVTQAETKVALKLT